MKELKEELYNQCIEYVNKRLQTIENTIESNKRALQSETKSSAGDKHETGRAMLQLEMEKAGQQLQGIRVMKETLAKIDIKKKSETSCLGSIIKTNLGTYFLSISAGQIKFSNKVYFAVSVSSPIGSLLLGKKINESVNFNGKNILLEDIS
ncbi:3-oxoacyl-ACP synthase [Tenacibaculum xiamenense]|uniref:3-oxoacyl-ACP synthase n=1 Tax=Tenacibaculum xiamenense TaxID=1261553 RepID=UPI0038935B6C